MPGIFIGPFCDFGVFGFFFSRTLVGVSGVISSWYLSCVRLSHKAESSSKPGFFNIRKIFSCVFSEASVSDEQQRVCVCASECGFVDVGGGTGWQRCQIL